MLQHFLKGPTIFLRCNKLCYNGNCIAFIRKKTNITEFLGYARASLVAQTVKNLPGMRETWVQSLGWEDPLGRAWQPTPVFLPGESYGQRNLAGYHP